MESELLKKLVADPAHWPVYLLLALLIIFIVKFVGVIAEAIAKRISAKAKEKRGLLSIFRVVTQVFAVALVIYIANAVYWQQNIKRLIPAPAEKPINSCETTVEIITESEDRDTTYRHFMDRGGYLAFCRGSETLLVASASQSWGGAIGTTDYISRGVFKMGMTDSAAGKPVKMLREAEYIQAEFPRLPKQYTLVRGKAICVINGELRFEFDFPSQKAKDGKVFVRDLQSFKELLR